MTKDIVEYAQQKYDEGNPIMSDDAFDKLTDDESQFHLTDDTYTVKHYLPMGTLPKVRDVNDVEDPRCLVQPKFDGISCEVILENGLIRKISTRGNGKYGKDLSNLLDNKFLFGTQWNPSLKAVYGELTLYSNDPSQSDRNIVAGICNKSDISQEEISSLRLHVYDAYNKNDIRVPLVQLENMYLCDSYSVMASKVLISRSTKDLELFPSVFDSLYPNTKRDGIVLKYRDPYTHIMEPNEKSIALKPTALSALSVLKDVEWSRGKSGFNAVALIDPVDIGGVTISRVTLPKSYIKNMDMKIGDVLEISRAGDVIPKIVGVIVHNDGDDIVEPNLCECGEELFNTGKALICSKRDCETYEKNFLKKFVEVSMWGIKRAPKSKLNKLIDSGELTMDNYSSEDLRNSMTEREYNLYRSGISNIEEDTDYKLLVMFNVDNLSENKIRGYLETKYLEDIVNNYSDDVLLNSVCKIYEMSSKIKEFIEGIKKW